MSSRKLIVALACVATIPLAACNGAGLQVRTVGFQPKTAENITMALHGVMGKPKCPGGWVEVDAFADANTVTNSNGVNGRPLGRARGNNRRPDRNDPLFQGQNTIVRAGVTYQCRY